MSGKSLVICPTLCYTIIKEGQPGLANIQTDAVFALSTTFLVFHLFPRYLDDDSPGMAIDVHQKEPAPYEDYEEVLWFIKQMREELNET